MENVTLKVDGMSCGGCVASVERVLKAVPGVVDGKGAAQSGAGRSEFRSGAHPGRGAEDSRRGGGL